MICLHTGISYWTALVLPSSLRVLHLTNVNDYGVYLVGLGIEISYPPMLSTILVDLNMNMVRWTNIDHGLARLWRSLGPVTTITIDMDDGQRFWKTTDHVPQVDLNRFLHGFKLPHLEICCSQSPRLANIFALLIASLPDSACDISFDFDAGATDGPADCDSHLEDWDDWDQVLIKRYERGLLNRVWFRCTTRMMSWDGPSSSSDRTPDHSILDRVRKLLPQSDNAGIIDVDYSRRFLGD
ncbi:hypothetical protein BT96DRAFT_930162 [Gymnopus androsaceus JB14]|uniref:F-box domain-containing protein n=1 Tax=Gymnopus androsaceus JB14 TaxID=1447944 RepID=A0A6A4GBE4_9AGAR|nr:hypothetical protein BT96DRAFT_930162 [Gymnopus androsaceus JB14]